MKTIRFIFMLCLFGLISSLQAQDTVYVDKNNKWLKKAKKANSYLVVSHEHDAVKVDEYTLDGVLRNTVTYSAFGEKKDDCKKEGISSWYYPDGNVKITCDYHDDKRNGEYHKFYDNGKEKFVANYVNGKKEGPLMMYYPDGTVWRKESYKKGKLQEGHLYNEKGEEINYEPVESKPQYPGGMEALKEYISQNLIYPPKAVKRKQEGNVVIQFVVDKEGNLINPQILRRVNDELDNSALAVVNKMAREVRWKPGIQDGEKVKVKYTLPVTFNIP